MSMDSDSIPRELLGGQCPASPADVFTMLEELNIPHSTISHAAMRTVDDSRALRDGVTGGFSKNLFLRNKKGSMIVVTLREDRMVNLKELGAMLGLGKPSFASQQRLMHYLGVIPGAVTPLSVINDQSRSVTAVLDKSLLELDPLHFHPCDNTMTTTLSADGLLRYMTHCHSSPVIVDFDAQCVVVEA